jgi:hypothetical protein
VLTVCTGAMHSDPLRDSAAEPGAEAVEPDASELEEGPAISVTSTDLQAARIKFCSSLVTRFEYESRCASERLPQDRLLKTLNTTQCS